MEEIFNTLYEKYVPNTGKCAMLAGELLRATAQIVYRYHNDGDMIGVEYGRETCNPAARFLMQNGNDSIRQDIRILWNAHTYVVDVYEPILDELIADVVKYVCSKRVLLITRTDDMWDSKCPEDRADFEGLDHLYGDDEFYSTL